MTFLTPETSKGKLPMYVVTCFHQQYYKHIVMWGSVTIDGVWIGDSIYWALKQKTGNYTLQFIVTCTLAISVCYSLQYLLSGNGILPMEILQLLCSSLAHLANIPQLTSQAGCHLTPVFFSQTDELQLWPCSAYNILAWTTQNTPFLIVVVQSLLR
jgi:hypothetical protein